MIENPSQSSSSSPSITTNVSYQRVSKPNQYENRYNKICMIENPFYHSDDGQDIDEDETEDESLISYNWYQSFNNIDINATKINKMKYNNLNQDKGKRVRYCNESITITPTTGSRYNHFHPQSTKSGKHMVSYHQKAGTSSYNSMRVHMSSTSDNITDYDTDGNDPFNTVNTPINLSMDTMDHDTDNTDYNVSMDTEQPLSPPMISKSGTTSSYYKYVHYNQNYYDGNGVKQKCRQIPVQRPYPPPHSFNHYSNLQINEYEVSDGDDTSDQSKSNDSTHI